MQILKVLGDPTRTTIMRHLLHADDPVCICELDAVIDRDMSTIYRHIKKLEAADLITTEKDGRKLLCTPNKPDLIHTILHTAEVFHDDDDTDPGQRLSELQETCETHA